MKKRQTDQTTENHDHDSDSDQDQDSEVIPDTEETVAEVALQVAADRLNRINILWEVTQAFLAVSLTIAAIYVSVNDSVIETETLTNALFVVLGFYFGRTNHTRPVRSVTGEEDD